MVSWIETKTAPDDDVSLRRRLRQSASVGGVKTTLRKGHVVFGDGGREGRGGVVKGEEKSMSCETRGKRDRTERGGISAAAGQLTPPLSGCDPKEIAAVSELF